MVTLDELTRFIKAQQLQGSVICLHSSLSSFGMVEGGPETIINGFLANKCTIVAPAFYYQSGTYPSKENYRNNGIDYTQIEKILSVNYNADEQQIDSSMGIIPKTMLTKREALRTSHPSNSFVMIGNKASSLLENQSPLNVYSVYKNIYQSHANAYIVLAGIDLTACTPIHFAEELSGKKLFRRWAVSNNKIIETEEGSCSNGFEKLRPYLAEIETIYKVGNSEVRLYKFNEFIDRAANIINAIPTLTHCKDSLCKRCNDMQLGGRADH